MKGWSIRRANYKVISSKNWYKRIFLEFYKTGKDLRDWTAVLFTDESTICFDFKDKHANLKKMKGLSVLVGHDWNHWVWWEEWRGDVCKSMGITMLNGPQCY